MWNKRRKIEAAAASIPDMEPEPETPKHFTFTCADGTAFKLPSDHPEITAGGIGGVGYSAIIENASLMPPQFEQYCTHRPPDNGTLPDSEVLP